MFISAAEIAAESDPKLDTRAVRLRLRQKARNSPRKLCASCFLFSARWWTCEKHKDIAIAMWALGRGQRSRSQLPGTVSRSLAVPRTVLDSRWICSSTRFCFSFAGRPSRPQQQEASISRAFIYSMTYSWNYFVIELKRRATKPFRSCLHNAAGIQISEGDELRRRWVFTLTAAGMYTCTKYRTHRSPSRIILPTPSSCSE